MSVRYVVGDVTQPEGEGPRLIVHVCNDIGAFGAGVSGALSKRWPSVERKYREWAESARAGLTPLQLGMVQLVRVETDLWVVNMIGQSGIVGPNNPKPVQYPAIRSCLGKVAGVATRFGASVHMPRIGCGLAKGEWSEVNTIVRETLLASNVAVAVYDLTVADQKKYERELADAAQGSLF